jgi:hypothetical protein
MLTFAVYSLLRKLEQQSREALEQRRPQLLAALKDLGDFYLEIKWDFHSRGQFSCLECIFGYSFLLCFFNSSSGV